MLRNWKKLAAGMLAVVTLAACLWGCRTTVDPNTTTEPAGTSQPTETTQPTDAVTMPTETEATVPTETGDTAPTETEPSATEPSETVDPLLHFDQEVVFEAEEGWSDGFVNLYGAFTTVDSVEELQSVQKALSDMGIHAEFPEGYDESFFAECRLVLIPRENKNASVRRSQIISASDEQIEIILEDYDHGFLKGSHWLLALPLSRDTYPVDWQIDVYDLTAVSAEPEQLRLDGYNAGWVDSFVGEYGAFRQVRSTEQLEELASAIGRMGKDVTFPESYDDAFFKKYRLVVIPMQSGSGSVRYDVETDFDGELITITLTPEMPGAGTADMADWLVLVPLERDEYPDVQVDLIARQTVENGTGNLNTGDK